MTNLSKAFRTANRRRGAGVLDVIGFLTRDASGRIEGGFELSHLVRTVLLLAGVALISLTL